MYTKALGSLQDPSVILPPKAPVADKQPELSRATLGRFSGSRMQQAFIPSSAFIFGVLVMAMGHRTLGRIGLIEWRSGRNAGRLLRWPIKLCPVHEAAWCNAAKLRRLFRGFTVSNWVLACEVGALRGDHQP